MQSIGSSAPPGNPKAAEEFRRPSWHSRPRAWLALCFAVSGVVNVVEALLPKPFDVLEWMAQYCPFNVSERSRVLLLAGGFLQLVLSRGLFRGKRAAWGLSLGLLIIIPFLHLGRAFDWHHAVLQSMLIIAFVIWRGDFCARSDAPSVRWALLVGGSALCVLIAFGLIALPHFAGEITGSQDFGANLQAVLELIFLQSTDTLNPASARAEAVFRAISEAAVLFGLLTVFLFLKPILPRRMESSADRKAIEQLIAHYGRDPLNDFALLPDKYHHFYGPEDRKCVTSYALWRDIAVTLAGPIGPPELLPEAILDFDLFCARQDWRPVFYETPEETAPAYRTAGFRTFKVAEDARIDLKAFTVSGGKFQNLRTALNKVRKAGWRYECFHGSALEPSLQASLRAISDEWLSARHGTEMTFDLGSFAPESLKRAELYVLFDEKNLPIAFASWLPYAQATGRSIDLMRHLSTYRGVMQALIAESLLDFQRRGLSQASLGNAPLANIESGSLDSPEEKVIRYLFERFDAYYGYKSLFEFKRKFHPIWQGRHVAYRRLADLLPAAAAIVRVHLPSGFFKYIRS
jgi:phosphatidylglycerol lysyltransferase